MSPDPDNISQLTLDVLNVARQAGDRICEVYRDGFEVSEKSDKTPLTTADLEAHRVIKAGLEGLEFKAPVLSEESSAIPYSERHGWDTYWLVDPLDGTREFIKRNGEFTVNIALIHEGRPILGVVYAPVLDLSYYAYCGGGAWKVADSGIPAQIHVRTSPRQKVVVARSRSPETGPNMKRFLEKLGDHDEVAMGSALKSCLVAEGAADVYCRLGPTSEWDTGAAQCIVEEAGGHITDIAMKDLRYNTRESLINPHFFVFGCQDYNWRSFLPAGLPYYPA
ncbi:MAG: 3'(2'),5'-bisphosphate nucleotidase CysQ [Gammaproteobacteria bacterium]|nr:3'(2'),5'-bisphosphate nucleotidase CysQ [Gammaproteobacteria bacterium]